MYGQMDTDSQIPDLGTIVIGFLATDLQTSDVQWILLLINQEQKSFQRLQSKEIIILSYKVIGS